MAIHEDPALRDRATVFRDRWDAGEALGRYLAGFPGLASPLACPIPAGGVPAGVAVSRALGCPLRPLVVRKVQIPWNPEAGFGAVTWDGRVFLDEDLLSRLGLSPDEVRAAVAKARANVRDRVERFIAGKTYPDPAGRTCIILDDGLASGSTMTAASTALRTLGPRRIVIAVPTGSLHAVERVRDLADEVVCLNVRTGSSFAVADAYGEWYDLTEEEALALMQGAADRGKE
ncbi:MAG TPA: phosphoribosyltransferase family protein [Methanomicrobiales archaeon]|nr:phosphoribosyltransferase family protein [Methanomicrobiales archaeon]